MNKRYYEHTLSTTREFIEYLRICFLFPFKILSSEVIENGGNTATVLAVEYGCIILSDFLLHGYKIIG